MIENGQFSIILLGGSGREFEITHSLTSLEPAVMALMKVRAAPTLPIAVCSGFRLEQKLSPPS